MLFVLGDGGVHSPVALCMLGRPLFAGTLPIGTARLLGDELLSAGASCCDGAGARLRLLCLFGRGVGAVPFACVQDVSVRAPLLFLCCCGHSAECVVGSAYWRLWGGQCRK